MISENQSPEQKDNIIDDFRHNEKETVTGLMSFINEKKSKIAAVLLANFLFSSELVFWTRTIR